jgi:hypothetical protein
MTRWTVGDGNALASGVERPIGACEYHADDIGHAHRATFVDSDGCGEKPPPVAGAKCRALRASTKMGKAGNPLTRTDSARQ